MKSKDSYKLATKAAHSIENIDTQHRTLAPPVYLSNNYFFDSYGQAMDIVRGNEQGHIYSRHSNPTVDLLQKQIADIEGGDAAAASASGLGAIGSTLLTLLKQGDHLVADKVLYGGTRGILKQLEKFGVEISYISMKNPHNLKSAIKSNTKAVYCETISNPLMDTKDIKTLSTYTKNNNINLIVDNTFAPPPLAFPLQLGADLVIHSLSKYISGHSDAMGGIVTGDHKTVFEIAEKGVALLCGTPISPFTAWQVLRGLKTLQVRMARHCDNALQIARFLEQHRAVEKVNYPGLPLNKFHKPASDQTNNYFGGMLSFVLSGDLKTGTAEELVPKFFDNINLCVLAASLGEPGTLLSHPWAMSHAKLSPKEKEDAGITQGLVRCSAGLEDPGDIIRDLKSSLDKLL